MPKMMLLAVDGRTGDAADCVAVSREELLRTRRRLAQWSSHAAIDEGVEAVEYYAGAAWFDSGVLMEAGVLEEEFEHSTSRVVVDSDELDGYETEGLTMERCIILREDWAYFRCEEKHGDGFYESSPITPDEVEEMLRELDVAEETVAKKE